MGTGPMPTTVVRGFIEARLHSTQYGLPMTEPTITFNPHEARTAAAVFERLFPADGNGPGAGEIGVLAYVDRALAGAYADKVETYRLGLAALDRAARQLHGDPFVACRAEQQ